MKEEIVKNVILGKDEDYIINMGAQQPSTHGVLRFEVSLQGETIKKVVPHDRFTNFFIPFLWNFNGSCIYVLNAQNFCQW